MNLDKKYGRFSLRVYGLILNFVFNFLALYGAAIYLKKGAAPTLMIIGLGLTLGCIILLSKPQK